MDYKSIKIKLLEIREMLSEVPQDCTGDSEDAHSNRMKYIKVKLMVRDLLDCLNHGL